MSRKIYKRVAEILIEDAYNQDLPFDIRISKPYKDMGKPAYVIADITCLKGNESIVTDSLARATEIYVNQQFSSNS
jgi:hypothetical protein